MENEKRLISCIDFENEDIIITDPCYLKDHDGDNWSKFIKKMDMQYTNNPVYNNLEERYELLKKGIKPPKKILTKPAYQDDHIMVSTTIYGDWGCKVYNCNYKELQKRIKKKQHVKKGDVLGRFCADAGLVCVCSAKHYSMPKGYGEWTFTRIPKFTGIVSFYVIDEETIIVEGEGNINFCSSQTGF